MTYKQCKERALGLIFSQQIAGSTISESYNNQADYTAKIPGLINDCEDYIATTVKPILDVVKLADCMYAEEGNSRIYTLPANCYKLMMGGLINPNESRFNAERVDDYVLIADNKLLVPNRVDENCLVEYYRYPEHLSTNPADNTQLDNTPDVHDCIPFYVAAYLVIYDSPFMYSAFYNNFETRLQRLSKSSFIVKSEIKDVYKFGG